jgi:hypothetical protein
MEPVAQMVARITVSLIGLSDINDVEMRPERGSTCWTYSRSRGRSVHSALLVVATELIKAITNSFSNTEATE